MPLATPRFGGAPAIRPYAVFGRMCYAPDPADPAPVDPKPATITLTQADLDAQIEAARKAERDSAAEAKRLADAEADRKAAEQKGEWEKLAKERGDKLATLEAEKAERVRHDSIREAVRAAGKDKAGYTDDLFNRYVTGPLIASLPADAKPADITKAAKEAVEQYVTDNPRPTGVRGGVPNPRINVDPNDVKKPHATGVAGYLNRMYPGPASLRRATSN